MQIAKIKGNEILCKNKLTTILINWIKNPTQEQYNTLFDKKFWHPLIGVYQLQSFIEFTLLLNYISILYPNTPLLLDIITKVTFKDISKKNTGKLLYGQIGFANFLFSWSMLLLFCVLS